MEAVTRAIDMLEEGDVAVILADDIPAVLDLVAKRSGGGGV